ncbi:MAG: ABC transporter ATP-binding protein [Candidatus Rokubacteria bacterium]|nr:ABC transporter ATP-binding protein [Candidatus Rokubacteria bacterium]
MRTGGAALSLRGVSKAYGSVTAVAGVSCEIGPGELVTLLGPSGSGKSTLLMTIAGFVTPDQGEILLNGGSVLGLPPYRRNIGVVFQQYALFPHLTAFQNVAYPLAVRGVPGPARVRAVREALELVKLTGLEARYPRQLSGGQQQRVALARALVFRPAILLMDEPLGALDRKLRAEMQLEIRSIQKRLAITTVYVTHDQEEALTISDRIAVMHQGRFVQVGSPVELYDHPGTTFVADFLGESNLLRGEVLAVEAGVMTVKTVGGLVTRATSRGHFRRGDPVILALRPERVRLRGEGEGNAYRAAVDQVIYLGAALRLVLRLNGETLVVSVSRQGSEDLPRAGEPVTVGWQVDAPIVIRAEETDKP